MSIIEDTTHMFKKGAIKVEDANNDLTTVVLSVVNGTLRIEPDITGLEFNGNGKKKVIIKKAQSSALSGTPLQTAINKALSQVFYKGNLNFRGRDLLTMTSTDQTDKSTTSSTAMTITRGDKNGNSQACTSYVKGQNEGEHIGDWGKHLSVGNVFNYSAVQYNFADKKASLNTQAVGFGPAFRFYWGDDLAQAGTDDISKIPLACRSTTTDALGFGVAPEGELPKVGPKFSISPTFYVFKDKNENDLGTQVALNFGFLNDFFNIGVGWNLSGDNAGEWFFLAGPSIGFSF